VHNDGIHLVDDTVKLENAIIPPCYIGKDVILINATVGPNVSLGNSCHVVNSTIQNSLIQTHTHKKNANLDNAMIGNHANFDGNFTSISIEITLFRIILIRKENKRNNKRLFIGLLLALQCNSALLWSQTEPEDIKLDADQFQELFSNLMQRELKIMTKQ
jgi:NDP-sugar pyrophosphorylase family protein